jgi:ribonuclease HI
MQSLQANGRGVIVPDELRRVQATLTKPIPYITDPSAAEAMALWQGVNLCIELGFQQVIFEGDSMWVVQTVKQASPYLSSFCHLIDDLHSRRLNLHRFEI